MTRASIILPTRTWTPACDELRAQLAATDELLIVCDTASDPVTTQVNASEPVQVLTCGDPMTCAGKANAIATGLEAATGEVIICTDGDFTHGDGWLETVIDAVHTHGAVTTIPIFRSRRPFGALVEPMYVVLAVPMLLGAGQMWGGLMGVERERLALERVVPKLRRTVGDDYTIGEHIDDVTLVRSLAAEVVIDGSVADVTHRSVRFCRQFRYFTPAVFWPMAGGVLGTAAALAVAPLMMAALLVATAGLTYAWVGYRRATFLAMPLGLLLVCGYLIYGLYQPEFEWGGRRYRWTGKYEVEILP